VTEDLLIVISYYLSFIQNSKSKIMFEYFPNRAVYKPVCQYSTLCANYVEVIKNLQKLS